MKMSIFRKPVLVRLIELILAVVISTVTTALVLTEDLSQLGVTFEPWIIGLAVGTTISALALLLSKYHNHVSGRLASILEDFGIIEHVRQVEITTTRRRNRN
jgi:hypothetical protein